MKKILITTIILTILLTILLIAGCSSTNNTNSKAAKEDSITLGFIGPLSGEASVYGIEFKNVAEIALEEINSKGGINGKEVKFIYEDGKCNPKDSVTTFNKLTNVNNVKIILGGMCSGEVLGIAPLAENKKVILLSPSGSSPDITNAGDFIFRTNPSDSFAGKVAAEYAISMGFKKAAIINENSDYAVGLAKVFEREFKNNGGKILSSLSFGTGDSDFRTQILKVKSSGADVLYFVPQTPDKIVLLTKQLKEAGFEPQVIADAVMLRGSLDEIGNAADGFIGIEPKFDENNQISKKLQEKYIEKYGKPQFPFYDAATYDAVYLLTEGIEKYGEDTEAIKTFLYGIKDRKGALGSITIDNNGDLIYDFSVKVVENGKLVAVQK